MSVAWCDGVFARQQFFPRRTSGRPQRWASDRQRGLWPADDESHRCRHTTDPTVEGGEAETNKVHQTPGKPVEFVQRRDPKRAPPVEHPARTPWWSSLLSPPVESLGSAPRWLDGKLLAAINEESPANQGVAVTWTALTDRKMQCEESQRHFQHKPRTGGSPRCARAPTPKSWSRLLPR